eukprot:GHVO01052532.1.p1 GENE.GHVO01052532.1~~GHVO01052532.1.p1  ORF type:complete len:251 (-),score=29.96 GHVO01052532.1:176-886(-)
MNETAEPGDDISAYVSTNGQLYIPFPGVEKRNAITLLLTSGEDDMIYEDLDICITDIVDNDHALNSDTCRCGHFNAGEEDRQGFDIVDGDSNDMCRRSLAIEIPLNVLTNDKIITIGGKSFSKLAVLLATGEIVGVSCATILGVYLLRNCAWTTVDESSDDMDTRIVKWYQTWEQAKTWLKRRRGFRPIPGDEGNGYISYPDEPDNIPNPTGGLYQPVDQPRRSYLLENWDDVEST